MTGSSAPSPDEPVVVAASADAPHVRVAFAGPDRESSAALLAHEHDGFDDDFHGRALRLALAMRGGVSLAVWIGGAVAEIDLLRSIRVYRRRDAVTDDFRAVLLWPDTKGPDTSVLDRVEVYGRLMAAARLHRVEPDVLAGASAGGLNAVLFAVSQRQGRAFDFLDLWLAAGSIANLLRPAGTTEVPSVLSGRYFFDRVLEAVSGYRSRKDAEGRVTVDDAGRAISEEAPTHPLLSVTNVSVDLSATIFDGQDSGQRSIRDGRGGFHFEAGDAPLRPAGGTWEEVADDLLGATIPAGVAHPDEPESVTARALRRLALAARTTSSFPGAFEAVRIRSTKTDGASLGDDVVPDGDDYPLAVDASFAFLAHRSDPEPYRVVDGGVLDNIPVARAFRAVRPRRAHTPTARHIVYLDPSPSEVPAVPPRPSSKIATFLSVLSSTARVRQRPESEAEDVREIEEHRTRVHQALGRLESLAATTVCWSAEATRRRNAAYVRARITRECSELEFAVLSPGEWQATSSIGARLAWSALPVGADPSTWEERFSVVRGVLNDRAQQAGRADVEMRLIDAQGRADAATCILAGIRFVEEALLSWIPTDVETGIDRSDLARARRECYDVYRHARAESDRRTWNLLRALQEQAVKPDADQDAGEVPVTPDAEEPATPVADEVPAPPHIGEVPAPPDSAAGKSRTEAELVADAWSTPVDLPGPSSLAAAFGALSTALGKLQAFAAKPEARRRYRKGSKEEPATFAERWGESPWRLLVLPQASGARAEDLPPLFEPSGMPAIDLYIRYARFDGAADVAGPTLSRGPGRPSTRDVLRTAMHERALQEAIDDSFDAYERRPAAERRKERERRRAGVHVAEPRYVTRIERIVAARRGESGHRVSPGVKLAGTRVANFSGFLSRQWRTTDWTWGRIDAAEGLVDLLRGSSIADLVPVDARVGLEDIFLAVDAPAVLPPTETAPEFDADRAAAARARSAADIRSLTTAIVAGQPDVDLTSGIGGLARLRPHYRFSVASRLVRLAGRALRPDTRFATFLVQVGLVFVRPLLVLVPLVFAPARALAVAAILLGGLTLATSAPDRASIDVRWWVSGGSSLALLIALILWFAFRRVDAARVWGWVEGAGEGVAIGRAAVRDADRLFAGACAAVAVGMVAGVAGAWAVAIVLWVSAIGLVGRAGVRARQVGEAFAPRTRWGAPGVLVAVAAGLIAARFVEAVCGLTIFPHALAEHVHVTLDAVAMVAALVVVGWILLWRWLPLGVDAVVGLLAGGACAVIVAASVFPEWMSVPGGIAWWLGVTAWANILWLLPAISPLSGRADDDGLIPLRESTAATRVVGESPG